MTSLPPSWRHGLGIAGIYAVFSAAWIALSDRLAVQMAPDPATLTTIQTSKGWAFVVLTSVLILGLVRRAVSRELAARDALRSQEDVFEATFNQAAVGIAHVGLDGRWIMVNQRFCDIVGWRREELLARTFTDITHPDDQPADELAVHRMFSGETSTCSLEKRYLRPDGKPIWIMLSARLARHYQTGEPRFFICVIQDIDDRKQADQRLKAALEEKEVLLGEVHHRVRNNLQLVISLLALEAGKVRDPALHQAFDDALARIHAIGLIHQQLYERSDFARVDFADYIRELAKALQTALATEHVQFAFDLDAFQCTTERAIPMAMVLVELVMNAIQHAFPAGSRGTVTIRLSAPLGNGGVTLEVDDDGVGAPEPLIEGTGLTIGRMLARQLDGTLSRAPSPSGTRMVLAVGCGTCKAPCAPNRPPSP